MKRYALCIALFLMVLPASAFATCPQTFLTLFLSAEPDYETCYITEPAGGGIMTVYVLFRSEWFGPFGAAAFRMVSEGGFTGVYLGETVRTDFWAGDTQKGIELGFVGQCLCSLQPNCTYPLVEVHYITDGTSAPCSRLTLMNHPGLYSEETGPVILDCIYGCHVQQGVFIVVNILKDPTFCNFYCWVPTEKTTWGKVKSLYSD